jgi:glutamate N-acetyltransferase / amino-acid N-acetyltransferase
MISSQAAYEQKKIGGGVLAPLGFRGGTAACGIKSGHGEREDLALLVSDGPAAAAATFTTNAVKAAPVRVSARHMRSAVHRAVVLNSGNANACTGPDGYAAAEAMAAEAASRAGCEPREVLVCSTGRIGVPFPIERVKKGLAGIRLGRASGVHCARAIMTSDTFPKSVAVEVQTSHGTFRVGGMAKGAGMIDPNMATMLAVLATDAICPRTELRRLLRAAVSESFNRITVDGDMSTNDTVVALANGASGVRPDTEILGEVVARVCRELARMIVRDGEGTTRVVEVFVSGAASALCAVRAANAVANSTLTKCAWAGGDPNWGRIMDALGYSSARMDESRVSIDYDKEPLVRGGRLAAKSWEKVAAVAARKEFRIAIDLGMGKFAHEVWTTDLTEAYVNFNLGE